MEATQVFKRKGIVPNRGAFLDNENLVSSSADSIRSASTPRNAYGRGSRIDYWSDIQNQTRVLPFEFRGLHEVAECRGAPFQFMQWGDKEILTDATNENRSARRR